MANGGRAGSGGSSLGSSAGSQTRGGTPCQPRLRAPGWGGWEGTGLGRSRRGRNPRRLLPSLALEELGTRRGSLRRGQPGRRLRRKPARQGASPGWWGTAPRRGRLGRSPGAKGFAQAPPGMYRKLAVHCLNHWATSSHKVRQVKPTRKSRTPPWQFAHCLGRSGGGTPRRDSAGPCLRCILRSSCQVSMLLQSL